MKTRRYQGGVEISIMRPAFVAMIAALLFVGERPVPAQAPSAPTGNAEKGKTLFVERACWQCHGLAAQGGGIAGPRLAGRTPAWPAFSRYVRRPAEEMIPYTEKTLPDTELADIYASHRSVMRPEDQANAILPVGFVFALLGFFAFAYAYAKGYEGGSGIQEGLRFGVIVGILLCCFGKIWEYMVWPV